MFPRNRQKALESFARRLWKIFSDKFPPGLDEEMFNLFGRGYYELDEPKKHKATFVRSGGGKKVVHFGSAGMSDFPP